MTAVPDRAGSDLPPQAHPSPLTRSGPRPDTHGKRKTVAQRLLVGIFVVGPTLALAGAVPLAWGWALGWHDLLIGLVFYMVTGLGVTVGYHRLFTHASFKAKAGLRVALGIAGSMSLEGSVLTWVATHRRHHKYSDREGDPHSPWRYGDDWAALAKGLAYAHMLWMFEPDFTSQEKFCPDLLADKNLRRVDAAFPLLVAASLLLPALIGGLWGMSWHGALTAFVWAGLVRIGLLNHVTWSINSICHTFGVQEFSARDKSRNVNWLAVLSFGESWHNLHHADPTCARHGVLKGQVDASARVIWWLERLGWAYDVRWPDKTRLAARRIPGSTRALGAMTSRPA
jgi:stearoyl-CoA desaturase (Delta-9 desaturase)